MSDMAKRELLKALEPFAKLDLKAIEGDRDGMKVVQFNLTSITVGDIKAARNAWEKHNDDAS